MGVNRYRQILSTISQAAPFDFFVDKTSWAGRYRQWNDYHLWLTRRGE